MTLAVDGDGGATLALLSELITQTTSLVTKAKFLSPLQRDQFLELSLSAVELAKRIQRHPRRAAQVLVRLYRATEPTRVCESTKTINISKRGARVETQIHWEFDDKLWMENASNGRRALARVAWVTKQGVGAIGIEILDWEDFWGLG